MPERSAYENRPYLWIAAACRRWLVARAGWTVDPGPLVELVSDDWAAVEQLGHQHGVEPLLFAVFARDCEDIDVPDCVRTRWEKAYYGNRIRNEEALALFARLDERCHEAGAEILALKGPAAMASVYRDIGLRVMADIDVLCRLRDVVAVARGARALGFAGGAVSPHHVALEYGGAGGGLLELHFTMHDVVRHRAEFAEAAWQGRERVAVEDWSLPVMSREHQVVFDVAHAAHHAFQLDLKHIVDLAGRLMLERDVLDWPALQTLLSETALTAAFWRIVWTMERLLQVSFNIPLDRPTEASLDPEPVTPRSTVAAGVRRSQGWPAKAVYVWRRLCPPIETLQAGFDLRSRSQAMVYRPIYVATEMIDLARRWRRGPLL